MSMTFTKLFSSITASTIWAARDQTRIVWITMLAMADQHGRVWGSLPGLAHIARVSVDDCQTALAELAGPDKYSRTKEHDGRRVEAIDGGWHLLNHAKYRAIRDEESIKESKRRYINARREADRKEAKPVEECRTQSNAVDLRRANTEAEADAEEIQDRGAAESVGAPRKRSANATGTRLPAEWILTRELGDWAMQDCGMTREAVKSEAEKFADYWHGVAGAKGRKVDWSATWRNWCRNAKPAQAGAHAAESFRERDQRAAADRVRELTGGLAHDKKRASPLPFEAGYSDIIEGEANEQRRIAAR
jgi:hypothetical protein